MRCSNWDNILTEWGPLIGRQYKHLNGDIFTFFGLVDSMEDYHFGMTSKGRLTLLSCVLDIEGYGYDLVPIIPQDLSKEG